MRLISTRLPAKYGYSAASVFIMSFSIPSREEIRNKVIEAFNIHPCEFQITDAIAQLQRKEVITISPTSSGKTLTFWIPLLFNNKGIIIVITALNILGAQNVMELAKLGLPAVNITGTTRHHNYLQCVVISTCFQRVFFIWRRCIHIWTTLKSTCRSLTCHNDPESNNTNRTVPQSPARLKHSTISKYGQDMIM